MATLGERAGRYQVDRLAAVAIVVLLLASVSGQAQQEPTTAPPITLPPLDVIAAPLLPGLPDLDKVPSAAQVFNRNEVTRDGYPALLRTLEEGAAGVTL